MRLGLTSSLGILVAATLPSSRAFTRHKEYHLHPQTLPSLPRSRPVCGPPSSFFAASARPLPPTRPAAAALLLFLFVTCQCLCYGFYLGRWTQEAAILATTATYSRHMIGTCNFLPFPSLTCACTAMFGVWGSSYLPQYVLPDKRATILLQVHSTTPLPIPFAPLVLDVLDEMPNSRLSKSTSGICSGDAASELHDAVDLFHMFGGDR